MDHNTLLSRLEGLSGRFEEVSTLITDPAVTADMKRFVKLNKEYRDLEKIVTARNEYKLALDHLNEAKTLLDTESDPEMREMAKSELDSIQAKLPQMEEEIKLLLVPNDPEDSKNAILEIRAGTGGDEASIFAGDLWRMYSKYCETKCWKMQVTSFSEGTSGGYKEIVMEVSGENVYGTLKYESGVHRVQRVPATETQGRVHTSAATVAVLPEAEEFDVEVKESDIRVDIFLRLWTRRSVGEYHLLRYPPGALTHRNHSSVSGRKITAQKQSQSHGGTPQPYLQHGVPKNIWTRLPPNVRRWYLPATVRQKSGHITTRKAVLQTIAST